MIDPSRLGFGTSRLHYMSSTNARQELLAAAFEGGIRWYDTAPAYGHGLAEKELGLFLRSRRDECFVTTKYGWAPNAIIKNLPEPLVKPGIALRALLCKVLGKGMTRAPMTAASVRASLEGSLNRLNVSYVDNFLLHDPMPTDFDQLDDVLSEMERCVSDGLVKRLGVAGPAQNCEAVRDLYPSINFLMQIPEAERRSSLRADVTYSPISRGVQNYSQQTGTKRASAAASIQEALKASEEGIVLFSTTRIENLHDIIRPG